MKTEDVILCFGIVILTLCVITVLTTPMVVVGSIGYHLPVLTMI